MSKTASDVEQWRPIPGYEGYYEASTLGRIRSVARVVNSRNGRRKAWKGRVLKPELRSNTGYFVVNLSKDGVTAKKYVHRLVLLTFRGEPADGHEACHGNDIRTDNRLQNLRWDTHKANVGDAIKRNRLYVPNRGLTHCKRGHLFDETNTAWGLRGRRSCKECRRLMERRRYHLKRAA